MTTRTSRLLAAAVCGATTAAAILTNAGAATADPGRDRDKVIIMNGQERPDIDRVVIRNDIPRNLPGYDLETLPAGSPGVIVMKDGSMKAAPEGAVFRKHR
ncbi:hypothetical protein [Nocardia pneumoniae]|uniref:hypothetical protein n=1 Tax=Nocardia pneumoniae TaxID=228601 RepID=UPI0012F627EB|nr:hypothetical protein [Nocardia pneumoniae]